MPSRTRKIRCDGAKPVCHNCTRRTAAGPSTNGASPSNPSTSPTATSPLSATSPTSPDSLGPCCYDTAPKRRGPDKNPGSRQRISHAQRELELLQVGLNGTADGGKVRRRRRRDTTTATASATAGAPGPLQNLPTSQPRVPQSAPFENHMSTSLPGNLLVNTNVAGVGDSDLPTHGAAHSPVGAAMANTSPNSGIGTTVAPVSVAQPISAATTASERVPPPLHLPSTHTAHEMGQHAMPNANTTSAVMGSPELYRALPAQGSRPGAHGVAQPHSMPLSHGGEANVSEPRAHHMHGDRHPTMQSTRNHRFSISEPAYSVSPARVQIQVPSQVQYPRPHRPDLSRLVSTS